MVFEMLVVFHRTPGAAPGEAVLDEELVTEVVDGDLITEILLTIGIRHASGRLYDAVTVFLTITDVGVIKGIDIDG